MDKLNASELINVSDSVLQFATKMEAITNLAVVIGKIGVVSQASDEADARLAAVREEIAKAEEDADAAKALAAEILQEAEVKASAITLDAENTRDAINREIQGLGVKLDAANDKLGTANAELLRVEGKLAEAKKAAKQILG